MSVCVTAVMLQTPLKLLDETPMDNGTCTKRDIHYRHGPVMESPEVQSGSQATSQQAASLSSPHSSSGFEKTLKGLGRVSPPGRHLGLQLQLLQLQLLLQLLRHKRGSPVCIKGFHQMMQTLSWIESLLLIRLGFPSQICSCIFKICPTI